MTNSPTNLNDIFGKFIYIIDDIIARKMLFPHPLQEVYIKAWDELKRSVAIVEFSIRNLSEDELRKVGLHGKQYELKIKLFEKNLIDWQKTKKIAFLKKALGYLNIILGSLSCALPIIEPFKEFKELTEKLLIELPSSKRNKHVGKGKSTVKKYDDLFQSKKNSKNITTD